MEPAYQPELWRDLFLMLGTCAGALVGLLFIVMSLHIDKISELPDYNMRATVEGARYNILHLLTVVVEAHAAQGGDSGIEVVVSHEYLLGRSRRRDGVREWS